MISVDTMIVQIYMSAQSAWELKQTLIPCMKSQYNSAIDPSLDKEYQTYYLFNEGRFTPSYDKLLRCKFIDNTILEIEHSIPKAVFGHNCYMFEDYFGYLLSLHEYLETMCFEPLPHPYEWRVKQIDIAHNFLLRDIFQVRKMIDELKKYRYKGNPCKRDKKNKDRPYWLSNGRTIKFYGKYDEVFEHQDDAWLFNWKTQKYLHRMIRLETSWRPRYLKHVLKKDYSSEIKLFDVIYYFDQKFDLLKYFSDIKEGLKLGSNVVNLKKCFQIIEDSFRQSKAYKQMILDVIDEGHSSIRKKYRDNKKESTYYYRIKKLREVGIDLDVIENSYHRPEFAKNNYIHTDFINLDNLANNQDFFIQEDIKCPIKKEISEIYWNNAGNRPKNVTIETDIRLQKELRKAWQILLIFKSLKEDDLRQAMRNHALSLYPCQGT